MNYSRVKRSLVLQSAESLGVDSTMRMQGSGNDVMLGIARSL